MPVFSRQIETAKRLIKKKGQLVTWKKHTVQANNSEPWKVTDASPLTYPVFIVFLSQHTPEIHLMQDTTIPEGKPKGLMASVNGFTPAIDDYVLRGTETYRVKSITPLNPNGEAVILYKIDFD
jgi:hypothetical protein